MLVLLLGYMFLFTIPSFLFNLGLIDSKIRVAANAVSFPFCKPFDYFCSLR